MLLYLNSKCNLPSNTKIAHNSTNIDPIDILKVLQDFFIREENNDIFNDTNNAAVAAQNHLFSLIVDKSSHDQKTGALNEVKCLSGLPLLLYHTEGSMLPLS